MLRLMFIFTFACLGLFVAQDIVDPPPTVEDVDFSKYIGLWFQVRTMG